MQRIVAGVRPKTKPKQSSFGKSERLISKGKSRPKSLQKAQSSTSLSKPISKRPSSGKKLARPPSVKKFEQPSRGSKGKVEVQRPLAMKKQLQKILVKKQKVAKGGSSSKEIKTSVMKAILQQAAHPQVKKQKAEIEDVVTQMAWPNQELRLKQVPPIDTGLQYYIAQVVKSFMVEEGMLLAKEHLLQTLQYLQYLKLVNKPTDQQMSSRRLVLPRKPQHKGKKTIVFDLDETLIHCSDQVKPDCDCVLPITFPSGEVISAGIYVRPYARQVLKQLSKDFQILVFTASQSCYANQVVNYLDPDNVVAHRLYREHCYQTEIGLYVKDLRVIDRPLSDMVLIDNAVYSYYFQMENGVPIIPYHQGKKDAELLHLREYLLQLISLGDVRQHNRAAFKLDQHSGYDDPIALLSQLYPDVIQKVENLAI